MEIIRQYIDSHPTGAADTTRAIWDAKRRDNMYVLVSQWNIFKALGNVQTSQLVNNFSKLASNSRKTEVSAAEEWLGHINHYISGSWKDPRRLRDGSRITAC